VRALGLDLGSKRIGVAVSDRSGTLATPLTVIERCGQVAQDHRRIAALVADEEAEVLVVGLPLCLSGATGAAAEAAQHEVVALASVVGVPVETYDERLTTVTADRAMRDAGVRGRARRSRIDQVAAAVMLQAWLDARRAGGE
jgi:putative Holliday junction resolvase